MWAYLVIRFPSINEADRMNFLQLLGARGWEMFAVYNECAYLKQPALTESHAKQLRKDTFQALSKNAEG